MSYHHETSEDYEVALAGEGLETDEWPDVELDGCEMTSYTGSRLLDRALFIGAWTAGPVLSLGCCYLIYQVGAWLYRISNPY